ncbi:MAG: hypothetical protein HRJ53_01505 [Acidobacteria bacterium Pan2503]|uniref:Uncharacterized protein n=1 Tax=Candidatus Acidiferrum panamense TaxID=2741543 RepID=A0A7V8NMA2_9BACT|nr:hypothetical protein [Candidatus Acidoferrum panamensis]
MTFLDHTVSHLLYDISEFKQARTVVLTQHTSTALKNYEAIKAQLTDSMDSCRKRILFFAHAAEWSWYDDATWLRFVADQKGGVN